MLKFKLFSGGLMSTYSFRRYYSKSVTSQFETQKGSFTEMCDMVCAVALSSAELWTQAEQIELELRTTALNPRLAFSCCSTREGEEITLSTRERALIGRIARHYAARSVGEVADTPQEENKGWGWMDVGADWLRNNPSFILCIQQPSMHEKMEAIEALRDWLHQHWPEGEKHLGRVV